MPSTEPTRNAKPSAAQFIHWIKLWSSLSPISRAAIANSRPGQLYTAHRTIRRRWAWAVYLAGAVFFCQSYRFTLPDHQLATIVAIGFTSVIAAINLALANMGVGLLHRLHGRQSNA